MAGFDPDDMIAADADQVVETAAGIERLAATLKTLAMGRVADAGTWRGQGHRSAEDWLAAKTGTSAGEAKATVGTAHDAAWRLAPRKRCARASSACPGQRGRRRSSSGPWCGAASAGQAQKHSLVELRDECARTRAAADPDPEATHRRIHRNRYLRSRTDTESAWRLEARGTKADGARIMAALRHTADRIFRTARAEGRREPSEAYLFDALVEHTTGATTQPSSVDHDASNRATADASLSMRTTPRMRGRRCRRERRQDHRAHRPRRPHAGPRRGGRGL